MIYNLAALTLAILLSPVISPAGVGASSSFSILDARESGIFNIGGSKGELNKSLDQNTNKNVFKFDYLAPEKTVIGVWTKSYPPALKPPAVNAVKIRIKSSDIAQAGQVGASVEIKGTKDVQVIPLKVQAGWNSFQESIDWSKVGALKEVVFVVNPKEGVKSAVGTFYLGWEFVKQEAAAKVSAPKEVPSSWNALDAKERGVFNIGGSKGELSPSFDESVKKNVLKFNYSAPAKTVVGVWTKNYPTELKPSAVNVVKIGVKVTDPAQANQISMSVEVKGTKAVQNIKLPLQAGWNYFQELIDWNSIEDLREAVFVVNPAGSGRAAEGTFYLDLEFLKQAIPPKKIPSAGRNVGLLFAAGLILALMAALFTKPFARNGGGVSETGRGEKNKILGSPEDSILSRIKRDFLYGAASLFIAGTALYIYHLGTISASEIGLKVLVVGLTGALIAEMLKYGVTGKHLTPVEIFQNVFLTGLLAATSSEQVLWQAPSTWTQLLMKSHFTAALLFLIYHISNACSLVSSGKHLRPVSGALIVGTPYLFGWMLLLEKAALLKNLSAIVLGGALAQRPALLEFLGRLIILFSFNEIVTNGIGLAVKGKGVQSYRAHFYIFLISLCVVFSPIIADFGSSLAVASLPALFVAVIALFTAMFSQAGLWGEVYLITGLIMDSTHGTAPSRGNIAGHLVAGMRKGMVYSGILVAIIYLLNMLVTAPLSQTAMSALPLSAALLSGALLFPFLKAIVESFDGSQSFFERVRYSYKKKTLYARGAVAGLGLALMIVKGLFYLGTLDRIIFGLCAGFVASAGVSLFRDAVNSFKKQGLMQSWRVYFIDALLGGFVGGAVAFYLDASQVSVVVEKFKLYNSAGLSPREYTIYPLLSKWGRIDLGSFTGGVKLLFNEVLAGVISWSIAAWLFAINRSFMAAYFQKDKSPIRFLFSKAGALDLVKHMIQVMRWGLWMAPIINTFLRMMGEATWYNQDGAVRTLFALYHNVTMDAAGFQAWSLKIFVYLLAYDCVRILIWIDHMGLRVATLVNLSFIGLDRLDERIARFIGPSTAQRYIPEAVKRFTTWAPLLIPFYIPRGAAWDYAWDTSQAIQNSTSGGGLISAFRSLALHHRMLIVGLAFILFTALSYAIRSFIRRSARRRERIFELSNREYKILFKENGGGQSEVIQRRYDISRRSYDTMDPCGRVLYVVDASQKPESAARYWPVTGNFPEEKFQKSHILKNDNSIRIENITNDIKTSIDIKLPDGDATAEIWTVTLENLTNSPRDIKVVPYLEWVLDRPDSDRGHTLYSRLFPEMEYVNGANAVMAWQRNTKVMGLLASDIPPEGFLISRMDFIGRARSIWSPRVLETLNFLEPRDASPCPTFDPMGSLVVGVTIDPKASKTVRFMIGCAKNRESSVELINKYLKPHAATVPPAPAKKRSPLIGHGEILPGTPQPYSEYRDNGRRLLVHTPYTPRPYDHALSNGAGHYVTVTNRGLHTTSNGNSAQNRITPDWADMVTRELPGEAFYIYDTGGQEWYSPTHHPLNDYGAKNESEFGVDGTALFRMTRGDVSTELTLFVPPDEPVCLYLLTVKNRSSHSKRMRIAPYFQIVLASQPEWSGPLETHFDKALNTLFVENPRNNYRPGPAFLSMSIPSDAAETNRGRFFGAGRGAAHPFMVENGIPDAAHASDARTIAAFLGTLEIPAGEEATVAFILGQADNKKEAAALIQKYHSAQNVRTSLQKTRQWWLGLMGTLDVKSNSTEFDGFQNWLKYQALAERIWARRGFYQTSGAYGFRDQLQDSVNLIWVDPALARKQIILHSSQQFIEGDVTHWFFTLHDGRTALASRSHASDNLLWLAWGAADYVRETGDHSILDEMTSYLESENPFQPLPKNKHGWCSTYLRSSRADTVYRHCMKSIDLVLEKRMGEHGIPLIGTGDWNDGLDEIGSKGKGESIWLGFFLDYILKNMLPIIEAKDGSRRKEYYSKKMQELEAALEKTWRDDRYLRAIHDDGTEIGIKESGVWEIDALTAAWAVMSGINPERGLTVFQTALRVLERENVILLGWPALRADTKPYLGRSSQYPEGVRENGMYCHGVQWLVRAARIIAERFEKQGDKAKANEYRASAYRLWLKISPISHVTPKEIEIYGGQPNKQAADMLTTFDPGRMIWNGYTGAAGWMLRQAFQSVIGASLVNNEVILPADIHEPRGELKINSVNRNVEGSPLKPGT